MRKYICLLLLVVIAPVLDAREVKVKWRDAVEMKDLAKARKTAESEKKLLTIIVANKKYDSDHEGADLSVRVIESAVKGLRMSSVIVRSTLSEVTGLKQGDEFNQAVLQGFNLAGNSLPMIIVLNSAEKKLVTVVKPMDVLQQGSKAFREVKRIARSMRK